MAEVRAPEGTGAGHGERLLLLAGARMVVASALLAFTLWLSHGRLSPAVGPAIEALLYSIVALIYVGSLVATITILAGRRLGMLSQLQMVGDVLASTGLVYLTGAVESIFTVLYPLSIVNGALGGGRRGAWSTAAWSAVAYVGLSAATERLLLPLPGWFDRDPLPINRLLINVGANCCAIVLTAALSGHLAEALSGARRQLERAESELTALSALHEGIVRSIATGILAVDRDRRITYLNPAAQEISGLSLEESRGQPIEARLAPFASVLEGPHPGRGEAVLAGPGGAARTVGYSVAPLLAGSSADSAGSVLVFQDLTELRKMEEQVRRTDRLAALGTLAASLAHELRNPLASMSGAVELLSNSAQLPETDRRLLQIVQREGVRLEKLLRDFLTFARPGEPRLKLLRLDRVAEEVVTLAGPHGAGKGVRLDLETDGESWVRGDEDQLRQVLWNLLGNGLDAVAAGGRVSLRIRKEEGRVRATIEDDGAGISPDDLSRIFDPFFTTKDAGTGLGLAIVHRILEAHGSAIAAESSSGHGARFSFSLPLAPPPPPAP